MQAWLVKLTETPKPFSRGCSTEELQPAKLNRLSTDTQGFDQHTAVAPGWLVESVVGTTRGS